MANEGLVLRPEGTAGLIRMLLVNNQLQDLPKKFFYSGAMFRYTRPTATKSRQFRQFGVELIGTSDIFADFQMINIGYQFLNRLKKLDYVVHINTLGDYESKQIYQQALFKYYSQQHIYSNLSEFSKLRLERKNPLRITESKDAYDQEISQAAPKLQQFLSDSAKQQFQKMLGLLKTFGIRYKEDPSITRGLDYYNNLCFEIKLQNEKTQQLETLIAGGRYDNLTTLLSGKVNNVPAVGFAAGVDIIANHLTLDDIHENQICKIGMIPVISKSLSEEKEIQIKEKLIKLAISMQSTKNLQFDVVYGLRNIHKQFSHLSKVSSAPSSQAPHPPWLGTQLKILYLWWWVRHSQLLSPHKIKAYREGELRCPELAVCLQYI